MCVIFYVYPLNVVCVKWYELKGNWFYLYFNKQYVNVLHTFQII